MTRNIIGEYFFYLAAIFFTWILVGQIIQVNLTVDKLVRVTGVIDKTIEFKKKKRKSNNFDYELRFFLKDTSEYFRFMDIYHYDRFWHQLVIGDSAEIFIRPKWLVPLGMGFRNDIFQMSVRGNTVFDVSQTKRNNYGIILVSLIAISIFILLARYNKRKQRK